MAKADINQTVKFTSGLSVLLALWLIAAPWLLGYSGTDAMWNDVLVGVAVAIVGLIRMTKPLPTAKLSWINVVLGFWLIVAPFVLQYGEYAVMGSNRALWNSVVLGIFIIVLSWLAATMTTVPDSDRRYQPPR